MKKLAKIITTGICSVVLAASVSASASFISADAASMGDVISKAREIGMPESEIQGYISQYGGKDYTSDQYQQAVNALEGMRGKYSNGNSNSDETNETLFPDEDTTAAAETEQATNSKDVEDFLNKSSEDKIKYIIGLSDDEAEKFWDELTDEQRKTVGDVLNSDGVTDLKKDAEKAAAELGITTETTEEVTETESMSESETEAETESETAETIAKTTNTMIWIVVCIIIAVAVLFAVIAFIMKKSNKKE